MIYVMRFGYLVLKRLLHAKKHCAKTTLYLYYENNLLITPCLVQNAIDKLKSG